MAFNFGAFLGGMSEGIVDTIEAKEKELSTIKIMDAEAATRERLAKNSERREDNKRNTENIGILKSLGYSDAQASWIFKGGSTSVALYSDFATKAMAKGIDPRTILDSSLINSDQQDPRNESALLSVNREIDETADVYELQTGVLGEILGESKKKPKEYTSLEAGHAGTFSLLQAAKADGDTAEVNRLTGILSDWKKQIDKASPEVKSETQWFSKESRGRIVKDALALARQDLEFTVDIDGNITNKIEGRSGPAAIAKLMAAGSIAADAQVTKDVLDEQLLGKAQRLKSVALSALTSFGKDVANSAGQAEKIKSFSYFKTKKNADGTMSPRNFIDEIKTSNSGVYKAGDVILVKENFNGVDSVRIKVFTGIPFGKVSGTEFLQMFHDAGEYSGRN